MAGIQITGLVSGMNWSSIISELIAADAVPMNQLQQEENTNEKKITDLSTLGTDLSNLQNAVENLGDFGTNVFQSVTAGLTNQDSTWVPGVEQGTPVGSYTVAVGKLATATVLNGSTGIAAPLSTSSDVNGLTLSTLDVATPITGGVFTVNGQPVTVSLSDSLQDVFTAISNATGGTVTASYDGTSGDPDFDKVTLTSSTGSLVLGAANDTSNFLQALQLGTSGGASATSASALGSLNLSNPVQSAGLNTALTGLTSGSGSFEINGVTIDYDATTDSLNTILGRINNSGAGVTAAFDTVSGQVVLTNNVTGNIGMSVSDVSGNLMAALGLTGGTSATTEGVNAEFTVNGGPERTSTSNTLSSQALGVQGLSVTVDSLDTNTIQVTPDVSTMTAALQSFITAYNQFTSDVTTDTQISTANGSVTPSLLSSNYEVESWAENLRDMVFSGGTQSGSTIASLDDLGIGFTGTNNTLSITDPTQLVSALANNSQEVTTFFQNASTGFVDQINQFLGNTIVDNTQIQADLTSQDTDLANQVSVMQEQLTEQQSQLTTEFTAMETAMEQSQSDLASLGGTSSSSSGSSGSTSASSTVNSSAFGNATGSSSSSSSSSSGSSDSSDSSDSSS